MCTLVGHAQQGTLIHFVYLSHLYRSPVMSLKLKHLVLLLGGLILPSKPYKKLLEAKRDIFEGEIYWLSAGIGIYTYYDQQCALYCKYLKKVFIKTTWHHFGDIYSKSECTDKLCFKKIDPTNQCTPHFFQKFDILAPRKIIIFVGCMVLLFFLTLLIKDQL